MNKTKIDWATMSWNPVTGCRHGCPYCYARRTAHRFDAGCVDPDPLADGLHVLEEKIKATPYPYGFEPTMHRYRLNQPERQAEPQTVFVCSMADLFGRWVPTSWIAEVLDACRRAPQHRYLFLTKNPARYLQLDYMGLLPHENNFWYGSTVANEDAAAMYTMQGVAINSFWSMEPLLGPVDMSAAEGLPQWVILGAETGNRADKVAPRREWVDQITISRSDSSGIRAVIFSLWNGQKKAPTPFLAIYKLTGINSSSQAAKEGRFILAEDGDAIYAAEFFESGWNCGLDEAGVRDSFRLILSNWAGD